MAVHRIDGSDGQIELGIQPIIERVRRALGREPLELHQVRHALPKGLSGTGMIAAGVAAAIVLGTSAISLVRRPTSAAGSAAAGVAVLEALRRRRRRAKQDAERGAAAWSLGKPEATRDAEPHTKEAFDPVEFGVSHPHTVRWKQRFLVEAWIYPAGTSDVIAERVAAHEEMRMSFMSGGSARLSRASDVTVRLIAQGCVVAPEIQTLSWTGSAIKTGFLVTQQEDRVFDHIYAHCQFLLDGLTIGQLPFVVPGYCGGATLRWYAENRSRVHSRLRLSRSRRGHCAGPRNRKSRHPSIP